LSPEAITEALCAYGKAEAMSDIRSSTVCFCCGDADIGESVIIRNILFDNINLKTSFREDVRSIEQYWVNYINNYLRSHLFQN
jgi:hypothetical protein